MATRATDKGTTHPRRLSIQLRVSNLPLSGSSSRISADGICSVSGDRDFTFGAAVVTTIEPIHPRHQERWIHAVPMLQGNVHQRIQERQRQQMGLQPKL